MKKQAGVVKQVTWVIALTLALLLPVVAYALSVGEAKRTGLVVETDRGYLRAQKGKGTPEVNKLVNRTNAARKAKYREIAQQLKVNLSVVERDFGKKLGGR